jgi:hypothetical protein
MSAALDQSSRRLKVIHPRAAGPGVQRNWANEHKHAAAAILDKQTFYLDVEDTYECIEHIEHRAQPVTPESGLRRGKKL